MDKGLQSRELLALPEKLQMKVFATPLDSAHCYRRGAGPAYFGCGTIRRYGFGAFQPPGYVFFASSSDTAGTMMTS